MQLKLRKKIEVNQINFMQRLLEEDKKSSGGGVKFNAGMPLLAALLLVLGVWGYFFVDNNFVLAPQIEQTQVWLSSQETIDRYDQAQSLELSIAEMSVQRDAISSALTNTATYPRLNSELYKLVYNKCSGLVALSNFSFQREAGAVYASGTAASAIECAQYVQRLRQTGRFISISYYGYSGAENQYHFDLTVLLPAEGGEADE